MITKGFVDGTIITRGFSPSAVIAAVWRETVRFTLYIKRLVSFDMER